MTILTIKHNFDPDSFMWLWAKYVTGFNPKHHCTNSIRGRYSRRFSKPNNPDLKNQTLITFDEFKDYKAIYICGVAKNGYSRKLNYPHNVHLPIKLVPGATSEFIFESWHVKIENGLILPIPDEHSLPEKYRSLHPAFTTCRIFRWAVCFFNGLPSFAKN